MLLKDLSSIYKELALLKDPYKVIVLDIKENFFRDDCAERYMAFCRQKNIDIIRTESSGILQIARQMQEPSLFAQEVLYVVEDTSSLAIDKMHELSNALENMKEGAYFLAIEQKSPPKQLVSLTEEHGALFSLAAFKPWDRVSFVTQWISSYCKKRSRSISPKASALLAQHFQTNRHGLVTELEKLALGCKDSSCITDADLEALGGIEAQPSLFAFFDALLKRDLPAMASYLAAQTDPLDIGLLRFVKSQLEKLIALAELGQAAKTRSQEKQLSSAKALGSSVLTRWIGKIQMFEVDIRSGRVEMSDEAFLAFFLAL
jgi:DNA polymerase III delta subunit